MDWEPQRRIEYNYFEALQRTLDFLLRVSPATPMEIVDRLRRLLVSPEFHRYAEETAHRMVTHLFTNSGRTWREAAREGGRGRIIYQALKNELAGPMGGEVSLQVARNAELIRTVPQSIARQLTRIIADQTFQGLRSEEIMANLLELFPDLVASRVSTIARTETSKTNTALTRARAEKIGLPWYDWETSRDRRVRSSHQHMQGILVSWNDPPSPEALIHLKNPPAPYHAGEIYNCRCYPAPIIDLDRVDWPHKVYSHNKIRSMTRAAFLRMAA